MCFMKRPGIEPSATFTPHSNKPAVKPLGFSFSPTSVLWLSHRGIGQGELWLSHSCTSKMLVTFPKAQGIL